MKMKINYSLITWPSTGLTLHRGRDCYDRMIECGELHLLTLFLLKREKQSVRTRPVP